MLKLTEMLGDDALTGFNGLQAGASVKQRHIQAFLDIRKILETLNLDGLAIDRAEQQNLMTTGSGVNVAEFTDYPSRALIFSGGDLAARAVAAFQFLDILIKTDIPFNVIVRQDHVYVFPRSRIRAEIFPGRAGVAELMGFFLMEFFNAPEEVTDAKLAEALGVETASEQLFDKLKEAYQATGESQTEAIAAAKEIARLDTEAAEQRLVTSSSDQAQTQAASATPATTAPATSAPTPAPAESAPATADTPAEKLPATTEATPPSEDFDKLNQRLGLTAIDATLAPEIERMTKLLIRFGQEHLFNDWAPAGQENQEKLGFFNQLLEFDRRYQAAPVTIQEAGKTEELTYPKGLEGYLLKHRDLVADWRKKDDRMNSFHGLTPRAPRERVVQHRYFKEDGTLDERFSAAESEGLQYGNTIWMILPAGGKGTRLKFDGVKLGMETELLLHQTNLQRYARWLKAVQDEANRRNGENKQNKIILMLSEDNYDDVKAYIEEYLKHEGYFGLEPSQIEFGREMVQPPFPAVRARDGKMVPSKKSKYLVEVGSGGHGDIHKLMYANGYSKQAAEAKANLFFVQDTNPQAVNAGLVGLYEMVKNGWIFNAIATPRRAGEKTGMLSDWFDSEGRFVARASAEYSTADAQMKKAGLPGDVADASGLSPFPSNLNMYFIPATAYHEILDRSRGLIEEMVKPKGEDDTPRIETQSQDWLWLLRTYAPEYAKQVGITFFNNPDERDHSFSPVKNAVDGGEKEQGANRPSDTAFRGETAIEGFWSKALAAAGANLVGDPTPFTARTGSNAVTEPEPANKVVFASDFAPTVSELSRKILGFFTLDHAGLAVEGRDIIFRDVFLENCTLIVKGLTGQHRIMVNQLSLRGKSGPVYTPLDGTETNIQVIARGYKLDMGTTYVVDLREQESGTYEVTFDAEELGWKRTGDFDERLEEVSRKEMREVASLIQQEVSGKTEQRSEVRAEGKSYRNFVAAIRGKFDEGFLSQEEKNILKDKLIRASWEEARRLADKIMEVDPWNQVFPSSEKTTVFLSAERLYREMPDKKFFETCNRLIQWDSDISKRISEAPEVEIPETKPAVSLPRIGRTEETEGMKALQKAMQREEALHAALNAAANQRLETTGVKSPAAVSVEARLTDLILAIEKQTGEPFPEVFSPDTGAYVTDYNEARIRKVLARKEAGLVAKGVVVVIMAASEDDVRAAHNAFGSEIRDRQIEVVGSGANLVAERLKQRYGDSRVQIKPGKVVTEDEAAYLAAAQLANGRVVFVGTNETVTGAYQISVAVMLQSAMEAAQAIATSA
ncbi:MAG: hypothetical protein BWY44_01007 [Candidatus Omnitrophica bacterium ADurb.Bin292]|nr:MAG: hypothetical protein BWY44_01007 [Candidatus Omnitrophica bacterium ADurb.Bin292]